MDSFETFRSLMSVVASEAAGRRLDADLAQHLNREFPPEGPVFRDIVSACEAGLVGGWLCAREAGGIRYGRAIKPADGPEGFSVDVVDMTEIAGPHHRHPNGEIDMVMPRDRDARFDGHPAGWVVYGPDSAHRPTVTGGRALVLYLLPQGAIDFTAA